MKQGKINRKVIRVKVFSGETEGMYRKSSRGETKSAGGEQSIGFTE